MKPKPTIKKYIIAGCYVLGLTFVSASTIDYVSGNCYFSPFANRRGESIEFNNKYYEILQSKTLMPMDLGATTERITYFDDSGRIKWTAEARCRNSPLELKVDGLNITSEQKIEYLNWAEESLESARDLMDLEEGIETLEKLLDTEK